MATQDGDWTKPQAMAIPEGGYFEYKEGLSGPVFPKTPACYGFTIIAKLKPGREAAMRAYGDTIEKAIKADPHFLGTAQAALSQVGALRYQRRKVFHVSGHLRYRLRQVHRRCGRALYEGRAQYRF